MAFTFVSCQGNNSTSSSSLTSANWSATAGDTVVAVIAMFTQTISAVTDANSTSFTVQTVASTPGGGKLYIAYLLSVTSTNAAYNVKVTTTGGPNELSIVAAGFTKPASTTVSFDQTNTASGSNTAATVNVASVTAAALVIGGTTWDNTATPTQGSGYTIPTNGTQPSNGDASTHQPASLEYNLSATGGSTTVNMTTGTGWVIRGTTFKAVSSGTTLTRKTLSGVGGRIGSRQLEGFM